METISEAECVSALTRSASERIATSSLEPMLKTSPTAPGWSISATSARTTSPTSVKQRVWRPSPWIVIGRPVSACLTNVGTTIPYWPVWRGPTVLNSRTMIVGSFRSRQ